MKNFSLSFLALLLMTVSAFSQNNIKEITFDLNRIRVLVSVGGDLEVTDNNSPNDNNPPIICETKKEYEQSLFQSSGVFQTVYVDVSNLDGNSCVSLIVTSSSGVQKRVIPTKSSSGIVRFDKVKSVILRVEKYTNIPGNSTLEAKGKATVWF